MPETPNYKSALCSCIICRQVKSAKGIHSHYSWEHTTNGNLQASNNGKKGAELTAINNKNRSNANKEKYNQNPKLCKNCSTELPYSSRANIFCSSTCSATYNNKHRVLSEETKDILRKTLAQNKKPIIKKLTRVSRCNNCGKYFPGDRKTCSAACHSKILSNTAKNNPKMGGNKNTRAHGWYTSIFAGTVWLESSYELKVANELDNNNIKWTRPPYLPYDVSKKYFPDFYLIDFDVYLDPKNDYLIEQDKDKINSVVEQNNVRVLVLPKNKLTWDEILKEIQLLDKNQPKSGI